MSEFKYNYNIFLISYFKKKLKLVKRVKATKLFSFIAVLLFIVSIIPIYLVPTYRLRDV